MALEFAGPATPLDDATIERAAARIGCDVAAVRAVIEVESRGGGFLPDGRPKILFERHYFSRLTGRSFDADHPGISNRVAGNHRGGAAEYSRLAEAMALDRDAALRSASWGAFQIMGDNCERCGFAEVEPFVAAVVSGEPAQLEAFVGFIRSSGLADALARHDWLAFARGYNGPGHARNRYREKIEAAYRKHQAAAPGAGPARPLLRMGDRGAAVALLQRRLGLTGDGKFGPATLAAVLAFQQRHGLTPDGLVGRHSWARLDAE